MGLDVYVARLQNDEITRDTITGTTITTDIHLFPKNVAAGLS